MDKPSAVTRGDWSREWGSQRSDEAHVTTPGVPIIELRRTGGPIVCNELPERRTESCEGLIGRPVVQSRAAGRLLTSVRECDRESYSPSAPFEQT